MRTWFCLLLLCAGAVSCQRAVDDRATSGSSAKASTNVVTKLDDKGRPAEILVFGTNGLLRTRTWLQRTADGRIATARTVDGEGRPKWTDEYSYPETGADRPEAIRRLKTDGKIIAMRFSYSPDGTKRTVVGPDGKEIPEAEQARYLEE